MSRDQDNLEATFDEERVAWPATIGGWSQTFAVCDGRQAVIEMWRAFASLFGEFEHDGPADMLSPWPLYVAGAGASKVRTVNWMATA